MALPEKCPSCGGTVGVFGDVVGCTAGSGRFDEEDGCGWNEPIAADINFGDVVDLPTYERLEAPIAVDTEALFRGDIVPLTPEQLAARPKRRVTVVKTEVNLVFKPIEPSERDLEFAAWGEFLRRMIFAAFGFAYEPPRIEDPRRLLPPHVPAERP